MNAGRTDLVIQADTLNSGSSEVDELCKFEIDLLIIENRFVSFSKVQSLT